MSHLTAATKSPKGPEHGTPTASFTGPCGIARMPPRYGIEFVDGAAEGEGPLQLMPRPDRRRGGQEMVPVASHDRSFSAPNRTGLPDHLKAGIEALSGVDLSDVNVHANSTKPAALQALAYTQGTDIHVAPGQERHLPHEAWHVVQQKQGRVHPRFQLKGEQINDDQGLEHEAEVMGRKVMHSQRPPGTPAGQPIAGWLTPPTTMHHEGPSPSQAEIANSAAQAMVDPQTLSITFPMDADGDGECEDKRLFFKGSGHSAILMINPDPQPLERFLKKYKKYQDNRVIKIVSEIYALMQTSGGISQAAGSLIAQYMQRLAIYLVKQHNNEYKVQKPRTVATWKSRSLNFTPQGGVPITETVTDKLTVSPLSILPPTTGEYGTKVQNSATPYMQELRKWASYIRGHMLNSKIHGPGADKNLVPISSTFNKDMEGGIEKTMKDEVLSRNKVVFYEISPTNWGGYKGSGQAQSPSAEEQLPRSFKITLKPMKLKQPGDDGTDPNNWEINTKKTALFEKILSHSAPGTTYYDPSAIPEEVNAGVYEEVNGGRWWPNKSQIDVWTVDGEVAFQTYSGKNQGIASWSKSDKPKNIKAKHYGGQPAKLELINNRLVVTISAAAAEQIKSRQDRIQKQLTELGSAVTRVGEQWKQVTAAQNSIQDQIGHLIKHNKDRSAQYYGQASEQVQRYAETEKPIIDAQYQRTQSLLEIEKMIAQLRHDIDGKQKDVGQFWLEQERLRKSDEPKFWSDHATREAYSDMYETWYARSTSDRMEIEYQLRSMDSNHPNLNHS